MDLSEASRTAPPQSGKEADDEEAAVGAKRDKRKPPAGRGPYKVAIMLTGEWRKKRHWKPACFGLWSRKG